MCHPFEHTEISYNGGTSQVHRDQIPPTKIVDAMVTRPRSCWQCQATGLMEGRDKRQTTETMADMIFHQVQQLLNPFLLAV